MIGTQFYGTQQIRSLRSIARLIAIRGTRTWNSPAAAASGPNLASLLVMRWRLENNPHLIGLVEGKILETIDFPIKKKGLSDFP